MKCKTEAEWVLERARARDCAHSRPTTPQFALLTERFRENTNDTKRKIAPLRKPLTLKQINSVFAKPVKRSS